MGNSVILHLIRHEKTQANVERKYIGWTDEPILKQVDAFIKHQPKQIYGSDLKRCKQTAACYFPQAQFKPYESLRELNFGEFEMKTYEQLKDNVIYRAWIDQPLQITPPNGETYHDFEQRVLQTLYDIVNKGGAYTFVIHGGVIRMLLAKLGVEPKTFQQVTAVHQTMYTMSWACMESFLGGARCTSFSEERITVNDVMSSN